MLCPRLDTHGTVCATPAAGALCADQAGSNHADLAAGSRVADGGCGCKDGYFGPLISPSATPWHYPPYPRLPPNPLPPCVSGCAGYWSSNVEKCVMGNANCNNGVYLQCMGNAPPTPAVICYWHCIGACVTCGSLRLRTRNLHR